MSPSGSTDLRSGGFLHRLESLRGVAAMAVAIGHCFYLIVPVGTQALLTKLLLVAANGRAAVSLFFVLSGLVLGLTLRKADKSQTGFSLRSFASSFGIFTVRRLFRICPAMIVGGLLMTAYLLWVYQPPPGLLESPWFRLQDYFTKWAGHFTVAEWLRCMTLVETDLNPVTWTLRIEILCSLLLPPLHAISKHLSARGRLGLLASLVTVAVLSPDRGWAEMVFMFYLGYLLPEIGPRCGPWLKSHPKGNVALLTFATAVGLASKHAWGVLFKPGVLMEGFAATCLLIVLLEGPELRIFRVLDKPFTLFLGRVSYSFYLLHPLALFLVAQWTYSRVSQPELIAHSMLFSLLWCPLSLLLTLPAAWALHRWVELPGIRLGKQATAPRLPAQSPGK